MINIKHGLSAKQTLPDVWLLSSCAIFFFGRCPELRAGSIAAETGICDWRICILAEILGSKVGQLGPRSSVTCLHRGPCISVTHYDTIRNAL